jgi:uncharacterized LabA/DUF88 family protein
MLIKKELEVLIMLCFILVDYDNFFWEKINMSNLIQSIVTSLSSKDIEISSINFRIYGGWFVENDITKQRKEASQAISNWPSIMCIFEKIYRISYIFADALYGYEHEDIAKITHTFSERNAKLKNVKFHKDQDSCQETTCAVKKINKWLKSKKACTSPDCKHGFSDYFSRFEQKQVDSHILVDFIQLLHSHENNFVFLMSGDIDFMPGIQYAIASGNKNRIGLLHNETISTYMNEIINNEKLLNINIAKE